MMKHQLIAILPCNDMDVTQAFLERLDFRITGGTAEYRIMSDGQGGVLHLTSAVTGWLVPGQNPFGLYLCREDVDAVASAFAGEIIGRGDPTEKPWGMYEFALNGPDNTLIRVGWPSHLRIP